MVVGVGEEPGVDLRHAAEQVLLVIGQRGPRAREVQRREGLAVGSGAVLGRADRVDRGEAGVLRHDAELLLAGEGAFAHRLVAEVEVALVLVDPLLGHVVGRVAGAGRVVQEEWLLRRDRLGVLDELDGLVGEVVGEVVAVFGRTRLVDGMVVVDEVGIPLARLRPQEPVPPLKAPAARPVAPRGGEVHLCLGAQVPLAHHVGVPAELAEDLCQRAVLGRDGAAGGRKAARRLGDARHAVACVVAPRQQARACRRAKGRGVPLRVADTGVGDSVHVRRLNRAAIAAHGREADVVEHDVDDARRPLGRLRRLKRSPVGLRVADVDVDDPVERLRHGPALPFALERSRRDREAQPRRNGAQLVAADS